MACNGYGAGGYNLIILFFSATWFCFSCYCSSNMAAISVAATTVTATGGAAAAAAADADAATTILSSFSSTVPMSPPVPLPPSSVSQWGRFEVAYNGPTSGNPFADVQVTGVFTSSSISSASANGDGGGGGGGSPTVLSLSSAPVPSQPPPHSPPPPEPLLAYDFESLSADGSGKVPNTGSGAKAYPSAQLTTSAGAPIQSKATPPGMAGASLYFGVELPVNNARAALDVPSAGQPFTGLAGANSFTISGWLNCRSSDMGPGGNRVFNWCRGNSTKDCGVDLVWRTDGSLVLGVNEWPDGDRPQSSPNSVPCGSGTEVEDNWVFFAVTYDAALPSKNARFYFGNGTSAATLDTGARNTDRASVKVASPAGLAAAFGGFSEGFKGPDRMWRGYLYRPRLWASSTGSDAALSAADIVTVQHRSNCQPKCAGRMCGSDGCGGTCGGPCHPNRKCSATGVCVLPETFKVRGFYDGDGIYRVRFMPPTQGKWTYNITSSGGAHELTGNALSGTFTAGAPLPNTRTRGQVTARRHHFINGDATPHFSTGTTCYAWAHQNESMQESTLATLRGAGHGINKMRMTVFPKWYVYNRDDPDYYPYQGLPPSTWDFRKFNVTFWQRYERLVERLGDQGVQADIIVFHPYDGGHWGFDCMGGRNATTYNVSNDEFYLRYLVSRLGSYHNVWWAMANEWDFCACKSAGIDQGKSPIWDDLFQTLSSEDVYAHETSIHNGAHLYNHSRPWITHVSLQGHESDTTALRTKYAPKPVVWDEVEYEGDIPEGWGALSGEAMADRFWLGNGLGVYVGHGETLLMANTTDDDQVLWWSKGNVLRGESPARIAWFRDFMTDPRRPGFDKLEPRPQSWGSIMAEDTSGYQLFYVSTVGDYKITLPPGTSYTANQVDYWNMRVSEVATSVKDSYSFSVAAVPYSFELLPEKHKN